MSQWQVVVSVLMANAIPIVLKLQADATNRDVAVSDLLRLAKIIATKLDLKDALVWIDRELNGYLDLTLDDLPSYRHLTGVPKAWNPYHGWQPVHFEDAEMARRCSQAPLGQALGALEKSLHSREQGFYTFPYTPEAKATLMKLINIPSDMCIHVDTSPIWNVLDQVRNLILNWTLELEQAGVLGENMTFTAQEKREAAPVSQEFIIQNVGVIGDVSGQARVSNKQTAVAGLDLDAVGDLLGKVRGALTSLPEGTRGELGPLLTQAEEEMAKTHPDHSRLRTLLASVRTICEGAAGNLMAQGIVSVIKSLVGS